jgi:hypothetical protein
MSSLTHERCSELLSGYLSGELASEERQRVEEHLEHCAQCSAERAGLESLISAEPEGLSDQARLALRAAVRAGLEGEAADPITDERDAVIVPLERRGARAGRYLGIAALLMLLAVGSLFVFRGGNVGFSGDDSDGDAGSAVSAPEDSSGGGEAEDDTPRARAGGGEADTNFLTKAKTLRLTYQSDRGAISEDDLGRLGEETLLANKRSAQASTEVLGDTKDIEDREELERRVDRAGDRSLELLAAEVPESLAQEVRDCGTSALTELENPALATYATTATLEGREALIIGFLTGERSLNRYALYAFEAGDCTTILTSTEEPLR